MSIFVDLRPIIQHNKVICDLKKKPLQVVCISKEHKMMLNGSSTEEDACPFVPSWSYSWCFLFEFVSLLECLFWYGNSAFVVALPVLLSMTTERFIIYYDTETNLYLPTINSTELRRIHNEIHFDLKHGQLYLTGV